MNFQELKEEILKRAKEAGACADQYRRAKEAKNIDELIEVIKENLSFVHDNNIIDKNMIDSYDNPDIFNLGKENAGLFNSGNYNSGNFNSGDFNSGDFNSGDFNSGYRNSGDFNSGDCNSGDFNSGDRNSGDFNSGDFNSGDFNSGDRNSGDFNSGDFNSGDFNSGDCNSGYRNSGDFNSGDCNSGYRNSGDFNSGDCNSGYRNSGIFCNRKRGDNVIIFNRESDMTWADWYNSRAYALSSRLTFKKWISWSEMTDDEKKEHHKAFATEGYLKVYDYKTAWKNLWETLNDNDKEAFTSLANFDAEVFEDITGIRIEQYE